MNGLLGKKLSHSFSKEIHEHFVNKEYKLFEYDDLNEFFSSVPFTGINVTIPYKQLVIPFLDELSDEAKNIGIVNTIIRNNDRLIGYNTDYYGIQKTLEYHKVDVTDKVVGIIGNGSTKSTISYLVRKQQAREIKVFARNPKENEFSLQDINKHEDINILFNATPVGMYPNNETSFELNITSFKQIDFVMDVVYNPLRTNLLQDCIKNMIKFENGLMMLVFQAIKAMELFHNIDIDEPQVFAYYKKLYKKLTNIVLIGMPMSGKSFFGKLLAKKYNKTLIDIDNEIERRENNDIPTIFEQFGEGYFRKQEHLVTSEYAKQFSQVISCGGGVIKNHKTMANLKQNGVILYIDFPLEFLKKCNPKNRPLLQDFTKLEKLYKERESVYNKYADIIFVKTSYNEIDSMKKMEVLIDEYFDS